MSLISLNRDFLSLCIATLAVGLSFWTVLINRRQKRQETFLKIHEILTSADLQHGRKLLYESARMGTFPDDGSDEFLLVNRALAVYDAVGMYIRRRIVSKDWILDSWHHSLQDIRPAAEAFVRHRQKKHHMWKPWPDLEVLLESAEGYQTKRTCCWPSPSTAEELES
jgi:hypothetical protein